MRLGFAPDVDQAHEERALGNFPDRGPGGIVERGAFRARRARVVGVDVAVIDDVRLDENLRRFAPSAK